jgi:DNA polymerase III gamma/tau subunit
MNDVGALVLDTARRGELHHAVILHGPAADSLRALAMAMARALNCNNGGDDDCTICQRIDRRSHPDVHVIEVAGERKMISVEQIRDILEQATLRPYEGRNKVFIVDPADALSVSGSNALLKTLEEPAGNTTFILITRSPDLLLPTIRSRSQSVFVSGEAPRDDAFEAQLTSLLKRFDEKNDSTALLSIASEVGGRDDVKESIALLASILRGAAAGRPQMETATPQALLEASSALLEAVRWLGVNADARMLVERALARLVQPA